MIPIDIVDLQQVLRSVRPVGFEVTDIRMCWFYVFFEVIGTEAVEMIFILKSPVLEGAEFICSSKSVVLEDAESIFSFKSLNLFSVQKKALLLEGFEFIFSWKSLLQECPECIFSLKSLAS